MITVVMTTVEQTAFYFDLLSFLLHSDAALPSNMRNACAMP